MKILYHYQDIKAEIKNIIDNIRYFEKLLQQEDLSELDYYKNIKYIGKKYISTIFSVVEIEVCKKETAHKLNHEIIRELKAKEETKLLERQNQLDNIENALSILSSEDIYIIKCKFFHRMKYKDITLNFNTRFKYYLTEQTIKKRVRNSIKKMTTIINPVYFSTALI
ncbi:MAG: hypothetical protein PHP92_05055 [Candidatus Nanoarchaeia archaeon]|nr:hypothetical protein [Candidatus Nanoarchaeia archaeon]